MTNLRPPIVLLHGALGSKDLFAPLEAALAPHHHSYSFNFPCHGGAEMKEEFSLEDCVDRLREFIESNQLAPANIFGYSMGGYVALVLALEHPELVDSICTLATKFEWSPEFAEKEALMLNPEIIAKKVPAYAKVLAERHAPNDWQKVVVAVREMMAKLGEEPILSAVRLEDVKRHVQLMVGDGDTMVTMDETVRTKSFLTNSSLAVLPSTYHALETVDPLLLSGILRHWLESKKILKREFLKKEKDW